MRRQTRTVVDKTLIRQDFSTLSGDVMLTTQEVADILKLSVWTIKSWRDNARGKGPPAVRLGRALRYQVADLRAWLADRRKTS